MPATESQAKKPSYGPFIGIVIILVILSLGGLYFWGQLLSKRSADTQQSSNTSSADSEIVIDMGTTTATTTEDIDIEEDM